MQRAINRERAPGRVQARQRRMSLSQRVRSRWDEFKSGKPGERFQERYRRRRREGHGLLVKVLYVSVGTVLFVLGLVMLPAPGPGFLVLFPAAALIAEESLWAARAFDAAEVKLRALGAWVERTWKRASLLLKAVVVAVAVMLAAAAGFVAYEIFFG